MSCPFKLNLSFARIQEIRFAHALCDAGVCLSFSEGDEPIFRFLQTYFQFPMKVGENAVPLKDVEVCHRTPQTRIGNSQRPLIFPHAILDRCRRMWVNERSERFVFVGLLTESRQEEIERWCAEAWPREWEKVSRRNRLFRNLSRMLGRLRFGMGTNHQYRVGDLLVTASTRGRIFPIKAWDENYYRLMSRSQFVLCPNGDFVWTYRFFEAAMCGAIPIVQEPAPIYDGFRFAQMNSSASTLVWSRADAEHNYNLCRERILVSHDELRNEVARQIDNL